MTKVEKYTQEAINIANDNSHGYSQQNRWGPDYDCSSLVIQVVENSGIPVKTNGATYTGNMRSIFQSCGFENVTSYCGLGTGYGMKRGDILLNDESHTAIYIGDGKVVHARTSEGNSQPGDQSGNEIRCQSYWNYPWNCVLRYPQNEEIEYDNLSTSTQNIILPDISSNNKNYPEILKYGDVGEEIKELQSKLNFMGYNCGSIDGIFGNSTLAAVYDFQKKKNLLVDGEVGPLTKAQIENSYNALNGTIKNNIKIMKEKDYLIGSIVNFIGIKHFRSSSSTQEFSCMPGKAKVEDIQSDKAHPYYLIAIENGGSTVHGWVNIEDIQK